MSNTYEIRPSPQKIAQFNEILTAMGLPPVELEQPKQTGTQSMEQNKQTTALDEVRRGGFIIGSIDPNGALSFANSPVVHDDAVSARTECKRLATQNLGKAFIFVKLAGAELVPTQRAVSI